MAVSIHIWPNTKVGKQPKLGYALPEDTEEEQHLTETPGVLSVLHWEHFNTLNLRVIRQLHSRSEESAPECHQSGPEDRRLSSPNSRRSTRFPLPQKKHRTLSKDNSHLGHSLLEMQADCTEQLMKQWQTDSKTVFIQPQSPHSILKNTSNVQYLFKGIGAITECTLVWLVSACFIPAFFYLLLFVCLVWDFM